MKKRSNATFKHSQHVRFSTAMAISISNKANSNKKLATVFHDFNFKSTIFCHEFALGCAMRRIYRDRALAGCAYSCLERH